MRMPGPHRHEGFMRHLSALFLAALASAPLGAGSADRPLALRGFDPVALAEGEEIPGDASLEVTWGVLFDCRDLTGVDFEPLSLTDGSWGFVTTRATPPFVAEAFVAEAFAAEAFVLVLFFVELLVAELFATEPFPRRFAGAALSS